MTKAFFLCLLVAVALATPPEATSVLLAEDFSSATDVTPPEGWWNTDLLRSATYRPEFVDQWHFDNPGHRLENSLLPTDAIQEPFAIFDSDYTSADNGPEDCVLVSAMIDATAVDFSTSAVLLAFDHYFQAGFDSEVWVEVYGHGLGSQRLDWHGVYYTNEHVRQDHQIIDISKDLMGTDASSARIRFRFIGDSSWYWVVDNVEVYTISLLPPQAAIDAAQ